MCDGFASRATCNILSLTNNSIFTTIVAKYEARNQCGHFITNAGLHIGQTDGAAYSDCAWFTQIKHMNLFVQRNSGWAPALRLHSDFTCGLLG